MYRTHPSDPILVVAFSNQLFGLDAASGEIRWEVRPKTGYGEIEIAIEDGVVIGANSESVVFVDYVSGHVHAEVKMPGDWPRRPTMIVAGGCVYVGRNGETFCMTTRGQIIWSQSFKGRGTGSVALGVPGVVRQADDIGSK